MHVIRKFIIYIYIINIYYIYTIYTIYTHVPLSIYILIYSYPSIPLYLYTRIPISNYPYILPSCLLSLSTYIQVYQYPIIHIYFHPSIPLYLYLSNIFTGYVHFRKYLQDKNLLLSMCALYTWIQLLSNYPYILISFYPSLRHANPVCIKCGWKWIV